MSRYILSLVFVVLFSCKSSAPVASHPQAKEIQTKLEFLVQDNELPGMNFAFVGPEGKVQSYSAGFSDRESKVKLRGDHLLFSGSIGKTYAVALLMQLVEEGKIDLTRKWISYFPDQDWLNRLPNVEDFSVEMLLQHRSGLPRYVMQNEIWEVLATDPNKVWSYKTGFLMCLIWTLYIRQEMGGPIQIPIISSLGC